MTDFKLIAIGIGIFFLVWFVFLVVRFKRKNKSNEQDMEPGVYFDFFK